MRTATAVTVITVPTKPTTCAPAPSWATYTGKPTLVIWNPKNIAKLIIDSNRKSRVNSSDKEPRSSRTAMGIPLCKQGGFSHSWSNHCTPMVSGDAKEAEARTLTEQATCL